MNNVNSQEVMLAELIESNGELSKVVTGLDNRMADVQQKVTNSSFASEY